MVRFSELDSTTPFLTQLEESTGPVVLVNVFEVEDGDFDPVIEVWAKDAGDEDSARVCLGATTSRDSREPDAGQCRHLGVNRGSRSGFCPARIPGDSSEYPDGTSASPHLFVKVAVEGVCSD